MTKRNKPYLLSSFFVFTSLFFLGCRNSFKSQIDSENNSLNKIAVQSSCVSFNEGGFAPDILPDEKTKEISFGKKYDENLLDSVLSVKGSELLRFSNLVGVSFYKAQSRSNLKIASDQEKLNSECSYSDSLPILNSNLKIFERYFSIQAQKLIDDSNGTILEGLYIDQKTVDKADVANVKNPIIIVKEKSDKHVLLHEYMHHLLAKNHTASGSEIIKNAEASMVNSNNMYDNVVMNESIENWTIYVESLEESIKNNILVLNKFYLEEIAIETELYAKYKILNLEKTLTNLRKSKSDRYTLKSGSLASDEINDMIRLIDEKTKKDFFKINTSVESVALVKRINNLKRELYALTYQTNKLLNDPLNRVSKTQKSNIVDSTEEVVKTYSSCSHTTDAHNFFTSNKLK